MASVDLLVESIFKDLPCFLQGFFLEHFFRASNFAKVHTANFKWVMRKMAPLGVLANIQFFLPYVAQLVMWRRRGL